MPVLLFALSSAALFTGVQSVTFDLSNGPVINNSTGHRELCCNGTQIAVIIIVSIIMFALIVGCIIYNYPKFKSRKAWQTYDAIY